MPMQDGITPLNDDHLIDRAGDEVDGTLTFLDSIVLRDCHIGFQATAAYLQELFLYMYGTGGSYQIQPFSFKGRAAGTGASYAVKHTIPWRMEFSTPPSFTVGSFLDPYSGAPSYTGCTVDITTYEKCFTVLITPTTTTWSASGSVKGYV